LDARGAELVRREAQVRYERCAHSLRIGALRRDAGEAVHLLATERAGVVDRLRDTVLEFTDAIRMTADAALAIGPVAGRQVMQHLHQAVARKQVGELLLWICVREQVFDASEAGARGRTEAV